MKDLTQKIMSVVNKLGKRVMPTGTQISRLTGNSTLTVEIAQNGGFVYWANRLDLPLLVELYPNRLGTHYEYVCKSELESRYNESCQKQSTKAPYDLLFADSVRIDVKATRPCKDGYWRADLHYNSNCDFFVVYCLNTDNAIERVYIVPQSEVANQKCLTISLNGKRYADYENAWELIYGQATNNGTTTAC